MSEKSQIRAGTILSYVQIMASVVIGIVYTPIMLRMLGKAEYGLYNIVSSVASMLALLNLGFNTCYIRYYSKYKKRENPDLEIYKLNGLFLIIFLIIGVVALACGLFLRSNLELVFDQGLTTAEYEIARRLMLFVSINLAISFPMSVFSNIISAHERFVFLKALNVIKTVASPFLTIPLLLLGFRSVALVAVSLFISIAIDIIFFFYLKYNLKQKFIFKGFDPGIVRSLFGYTFFIALHMIVDQINWNVDKLLLGRLRGTEETAIYSVGFTLYSYYMTIGLPIAGMFTPRIHSLVEDTNEDLTSRKRYLTELFVKVGRIQWLILSLIMTGLIFFGKPFIAFWAGDGYEKAYFVCLLLIIPGTIDLIQNMGIEIQRAQNKHRFRSYIYMAMAAINVALSVFLCSRYGAVGSAIGTAISLVLVQGIIINIYLHKKCNIDVIAFWKDILRLSLGLVIPCAFGVLIVSFCDLYSIGKLVLAIAFYVLLFCISMWLLGMNSYEKKMVLKFKGRFISMRFFRKIRFFIRDRIINSRNRKQLKNYHFSIISNDCLGGVICKDLKCRFNSPTVNFYFSAEDYIKFISNLREYIEKGQLKDVTNPGEYVKVLIEIPGEQITAHCIHYKTAEDFIEKWNSRKTRINYENCFFIMNDRNGCEEVHLKKFDSLPYKNKVCFVHKEYPEYSSTFYIKGAEKDSCVKGMTDYKHKFGIKKRYDDFDFVTWLNSETES